MQIPTSYSFKFENPYPWTIAFMTLVGDLLSLSQRYKQTFFLKNTPEALIKAVKT